MDISKFIEIGEPLGVLGVRVTHKGELTAQWLLEDECRRNVYSAAKSYTSCAVGFAIQEGLVSLEEKLVDAFPDELPETVSDNLAKATVRDLLTMCLGQAQGGLMGVQRPLYEEKNWVKLSLGIPFVHEPGTQFVYNNVGPYLAGMLVQRRAGCDLVSYLMPRLFEPLGISNRPTWETDPLGNTFGAGGLLLTLTELHKFGLFCLQGGEWSGRQLLSREWITECAKCQAVGEDYGYLFWRGEYDSFRADGKYCQISMILPEQDAVVTVVSECRRGGELMQAIYDHVCAQL